MWGKIDCLRRNKWKVFPLAVLLLLFRSLLFHCETRSTCKKVEPPEPPKPQQPHLFCFLQCQWSIYCNGIPRIKLGSLFVPVSVCFSCYIKSLGFMYRPCNPHPTQSTTQNPNPRPENPGTPLSSPWGSIIESGVVVAFIYSFRCKGNVTLWVLHFATN